MSSFAAAVLSMIDRLLTVWASDDWVFVYVVSRQFCRLTQTLGPKTSLLRF